MIRNVVVHLTSEQPLLADLYALPSASDAGLLCTNVRSIDGKRPVFIDSTRSAFFFPYHVVRFLEMPEGAVAGLRAAGNGQGVAGAGMGNGDIPDGEFPDSLLPIALGAPDDEAAEEDLELEIDEAFLQKIRDI